MKVILHIGLDVHNDSIALSLAPSDSTEVRRWGTCSSTSKPSTGTCSPKKKRR